MSRALERGPPVPSGASGLVIEQGKELGLAQTSNFTVTSDDGLDIFVRRRLPAPGRPLNGVVQISHGLAEHGKRYSELSAKLTDAGYAVYIGDHRGHGRSVIESRDFGFFGRTDGWLRAMRDMDRIYRQIQEEHEDVPIILLGHSMGAQLSQQFIMQEGRDLAGVVLSGPSGHIGLMRHFGRILARLERARLGEYGRSKLLHTMSFGEFNKDFEPARTPFDWLSRDESEVDAYVQDPLCGFVSTTQLWIDMLDAASNLQQARNYKWARPSLPVLIMAGDKDPVSRGGGALKRLVKVLRKSGLQTVQLKIYENCRHELFHETNREEVFMDLIKWIDNVVGVSDTENEKIVLPNPTT